MLLGNHDQGAMFDPDGFNPAGRAGHLLDARPARVAGRTAASPREALGVPGRAAAQPSRERLPVRPRLGPQPAQRICLPRRHLQPAEDGADLRPGRERYCFQGHTHVPGIFTESMQFLAPRKSNYTYKLDGRKTLCNVGSVGQPRDGDWRACYVVSTARRIRSAASSTTVETTIGKIYDIPDLDNFLGDRLREGR